MVYNHFWGDKMKQVIVMREDLKMSPGKLAAQACHASLGAYNKADKDHIDEWNRSGTTKVVLGVFAEDQLISLFRRAVASYLACVLVADEGRTEVTPGTITGLGIGPASSDQIDEITGHLRLYGKTQTEGYGHGV